jgi:hypothetical protein
MNRLVESIRRSATFTVGALLVLALIVTEVAIVKTSPDFNDDRRIYEFCMISLFGIIGATVGWFLGIVL